MVTNTAAEIHPKIMPAKMQADSLSRLPISAVENRPGQLGASCEPSKVIATASQRTNTSTRAPNKILIEADQNQV